MLIRIARFSLVIALLLLVGCNFPLFSAPAENPGMIYTAAAGTTIAQLTQAAEIRPTITFQVLPTDATPPGELFTPTPTSTSVADFQTATPPSPLATRTPDQCDRAEFVRDVTIPDNTELAPGEIFTKTWRLRNAGTCTWTADYALVLVDGERMAGPDSQRLTGITVPPGETVDLSVELEAPEATGTYQGNWQLRNADGRVFGVGSDGTRNFWVRIRVALPGGLALDLIARASAAVWEIDRDGTLTRLAWDGDEGSPDGVARLGDQKLLEDGRTSGRILLTYPPQVTDGLIQGTYPEYTVQSGDRLRGNFGFLAQPDGSCGPGEAFFRVLYREGNNTRQLAEWSKRCDRSLTTINIDLAELRGKTVRFILQVETDGPPDGDLAIWSSIRVER